MVYLFLPFRLVFGIPLRIRNLGITELHIFAFLRGVRMALSKPPDNTCCLFYVYKSLWTLLVRIMYAVCLCYSRVQIYAPPLYTRKVRMHESKTIVVSFTRRGVCVARNNKAAHSNSLNYMLGSGGGGGSLALPSVCVCLI